MRIAILVEELFEDLELFYPKIYFEAAGAVVKVVGPKNRQYTGKRGGAVHADINIERARSSEFDAVIIPGGFAPDYLRRSKAVLNFVKEMESSGKVVAAMCHAGWVLISAELVKGRRLTSYHAIADDMKNAGAKLLDQPVVQDKKIITSRSPEDLPFFCQAIAKELNLPIELKFET